MNRLQMEQNYLDSVAHIHAQDAATFVACLVVYLALCLIAFWKSDKREGQS